MLRKFMFCTVIDQSMFISNKSCSTENMNRMEDSKSYFGYYWCLPAYGTTIYNILRWCDVLYQFLCLRIFIDPFGKVIGKIWLAWFIAISVTTELMLLQYILFRFFFFHTPTFTESNLTWYFTTKSSIFRCNCFNLKMPLVNKILSYYITWMFYTCIEVPVVVIISDYSTWLFLIWRYSLEHKISGWLLTLVCV